MRQCINRLKELSLAALVLAGCGEEGPAEQRWQIDFACAVDATRTANIRLKVFADECGGTDVAYETNLLRNKAAPTEVLSPGTYHFEALAYDGNGNLVAGDCQTFELPSQQVQFTIASPDCVLSMPMDGGSEEPDQDGSIFIPDDEADGGTTSPGSDAGGPAAPACALKKGNCRCESFGGHTYLFCPDALDWVSARERCRAQGGDLVVVESATENMFLKSSGGGSPRWLGANDRGVNGSPLGSCPGACNKTGDEGTWKWVNAAGNNERGTTFCEASEDSTECNGGGYASWAGNEPNNAVGMGAPCIPYFTCAVGEDCGLMAADGTWQDVSCDAKQAFICESF